ncbi:MAG TPA: hypothetical protein VK066_12360 [Chloroflexota bacterium]|nr:hypothetical protein [Chloroflexota bacterium]
MSDRHGDERPASVPARAPAPPVRAGNRPAGPWQMACRLTTSFATQVAVLFVVALLASLA